MHSSVPESRIRVLVDSDENAGGRYVLYWMISSRRARHNFALQYAACRAEALGIPLLIVEALRLDYPWASERIHRFVIDGMRDNRKAFATSAARYYPYIEASPGAAKGMLSAFAAQAALVVSDDTPAFFFPHMLKAAASKLATRLVCVDSCGLYPFRDSERVFSTAASFRRHLQKELVTHLGELSEADPLRDRTLVSHKHIPTLPCARWPEAQSLQDRAFLQALAIDHSVTVAPLSGGSRAALERLGDFIDNKLGDYASRRNEPSQAGESGLSPYLHFGHISAAEIFLAVAESEGWTPANIAERATGSRSGWWGMSAAVEAFIDQLITWRELGYNGAANDPAFSCYESLPSWAQVSLEAHACDPREYLYSSKELEAARTHDVIWNAAQRQLVREGTIHNYLRMLWGKKILEWSPTPRIALQIMIELNNKYALDGRDPNSYSGILWILGRYDRAWGPERKIFGKVRYMSSANTARKYRLSGYLETYA